MKVPKGFIDRDLNYIWDCSCFKDPECPYCKGLNEQKILDSFASSRGSIYYGNLKAYLSLKGKDIADKAVEIKTRTGKFTPGNLIEIADHFNFPRKRMKALIEWLEECFIIPSGTYERLKSRGWQPTKIPYSKPWLTNVEKV